MSLNKKNYEIIAEELERIIESGIIKPGEKLDTIENLAKQYHVGRSTIREALSNLKARGLIESRQGGGTYVMNHPLQAIDSLQNLQTTNKTELVQIMQVRKIIEVGTIELAAMYRTKENLDELERIVQQMGETTGSEEVTQIYDVNFHVAIARASQNPLLVTVLESISATMIHTIRESRKLWMYSEQSSNNRLLDEHRKMYEAIKEQDPKKAVNIMKTHLGKVEGVLNPNSECPV
jgi:GntR family transcriptional regulator, transcriptional repressor for pyruvate dehydrogenase complex